MSNEFIYSLIVNKHVALAHIINPNTWTFFFSNVATIIDLCYVL